MNQQTLSAFIWAVADLLRGDYKQSDYGKVILPFTVLRRLDCVLEATKPAVLAEYEAKQKAGVNPEPFLLRKSGQSFYNTSPLDMKKLMGDQDHIRENLRAYLQAFSPAVRDIFERFELHTQRSRGSTRRGCSTWSPRSSRTSTCISRPSATRRWARCSRS
jgi:type I restriction enzyme M protein